MTGNHKAVGLTLMALFAYGAIAVQGASAHPIVFDGGAPAVAHFTGTNEEGTKHRFTFAGGEGQCTHATFDATAAPVSGAVTELTLAPTYSGCTFFGFATGHVIVNGCTYTLTTPTTLPNSDITWHPSQVHIICPEGKKIVVTPTTFGSSVCSLSLGGQTPTSGHIVARNAGSPSVMDITDEVTLKGIHYTGTGGACGTAGTNVEIEGKTTIRCFSNVDHTIQIGCTFS